MTGGGRGRALPLARARDRPILAAMAKSVFFFGDGQAEGDPKRRDLLGGKGAGLGRDDHARAARPPGLHHLDRGVQRLHAHPEDRPTRRAREVDAALARLEKAMGARLGDPAAPLLVSVRSGARASMPGMMDTILNLGLNDAVAEGLAARTGSPRFAFDAYRRFIAMHASIALGVSKEPVRPRARRGARPRRRPPRASTARASTPRSSSAACPTRTSRPRS